MKIPEYAQMIRHMTRDKTTDVPGSMAHGLRTGLYDGGRAGFDNGGRIGFLSGGDVERIVDIYNAGLEGGYRTSANFIAEQLGKKPGKVSTDIVGRKINELIEDGTLTKQKELETTKTKGKRKIYKVARPIETRDRINNPDIPKDAKFKMQVPGGKLRGKSSSTDIIYDVSESKLNERLEEIEKVIRGSAGSNVRTTVPKNATYLKDRKTYRIPTEEEYIFEEYNPKTKKSKFLMTGARKIEEKKYFSKSTHSTLKEAIEAKEKFVDSLPEEFKRVDPKAASKTVPGFKNIYYRDLISSKTGEVKRVYDVKARDETKYVKGKTPSKFLINERNIESLEEAQEIVRDFRDKNPIRNLGREQLEKKLQDLWSDPRIKKIFNQGVPGEEEIKIAQEILGKGTTERMAQGKLAELADALTPGGMRDIKEIEKIDSETARSFYDKHVSRDIARTIEEVQLGRSVGEKPLYKQRQDISEQNPLRDIYQTDELTGVASSYRLNSKPYSIFGQVIAGTLNQNDKRQWDGIKSLAEEKLQKNLALPNTDPNKKRLVKEARDEFNSKAEAFENEFNKYKSRGFKKVVLPRISLDAPSVTIKNKAAYNKYKTYFDNNYKQLNYSFEIPEDIKPLPEISKELKNKKSLTYKNFIRDVKKAAGNFIKNVEQYDEKELFNKIKNFLPDDLNKFKRLIPRFVSTDDISEKRFASANNIMSDATYVDDVEETFTKRNPLTTQALGSTAVGGAMLAQNPIRSGLGKAVRTLGTNAAVVPLNAYTIYDNLKKGENIADAVIDPFVGAEFMLPGLFKENVDKITKNKTLQKLLTFGKYGRLMTPVGAGITAAGLGIDAYKYGKKRIGELQAMSPEERAKLAQERDDFSFGEYSGAAEGGIASLNVNKK